MARSERQVPKVYFGRPGQLVSMPWPRGDEDRTFDRIVFDFASGSGMHQVSSLAHGSRQFDVKWNALHVDNFRMIEQYWTNAMGPGPWVYVDPSQTNMLLANQAAATNQLLDTTGFATNSGAPDAGTLVSNNTLSLIHRTNAIRNLRWQFTITANAFPVLSMTTPYRNWYGFPVVPTLPYTFSCYGRPDGTVDSSITMAMKVQWYDLAGVQIGTDVSGGDIVMTGWQQLSVTATAPAGAAYIKPLWVATGSTITTGSSIYIDDIMLEQDSVVNAWAPGTGLRAVEILSLSESVPFETRMRQDVTLSLRELSA